VNEANINTATLDAIVKLAGVIVSWGVSIYFISVKAQPKIISEHPFFAQGKNITVIVVGVFLALTWGLLGNFSSTKYLATISIAGCIAGFTAFFWTAELVRKATKNGGDHNSTILLFAFVTYSTLLSWGLTAATVFLAVVLLNPGNKLTGVSLVTPIRFTAIILATGTASTRTNEDVPIRLSSGQVNFGCEEQRPVEVRFTLPENASLVGQLTATWQNFSNANTGGASVAQIDARTFVARSVVRGLDYQNFAFGIRNCPGGGHGELVLTGTYKTTTTREEPKEISLTASLVTGPKETVWVSLPSEEQMSITRVTVSINEDNAPVSKSQTLILTQDQPSQSTADQRVKVTFDSSKRRVGLNAAL
jgi:multisubunit Na+/H+ antiporter MnhE subunit